MVIYCLDTSSLIHAATRAYPFRAFPSFWSKLDALVVARGAILSLAALDEIEKKSDEVHVWVKARPSMVMPIDVNIQKVVREILGDPWLKRLVDTKKGRSGADPFVVALGKTAGATVVTEEPEVGRNAKSPKIPDCCRVHAVPCMTMLEMIQAVGWVF